MFAHSPRVSFTLGSPYRHPPLKSRITPVMQVVLDAETGTTPIYLTTAVCPGGLSVGGTACTSLDGVRHPSWNLYRPVTNNGIE